MRCTASPGSASTALAGQPGSDCSACANAVRSAPGCSCRSMRVRRPPCPHRSCAAPMSITARGAPPAATVPAMRTVCDPCGPACSCSCAGPLPSVARPRACKAAALRNTVAGASMASRSLVAKARGMSAGATAGSSSASAPTTRSTTRAGAGAGATAGAVAGGVAGCVVGGASTWAMVDSSSQGLARATCGWLASCA